MLVLNGIICALGGLFAAVWWPFSLQSAVNTDVSLHQLLAAFSVAVLTYDVYRWRIGGPEGLGVIKQRQLEESELRNHPVIYGRINLFGANLSICYWRLNHRLRRARFLRLYWKLSERLGFFYILFFFIDMLYWQNNRCWVLKFWFWSFQLLLINSLKSKSALSQGA